jgi:hypothetical protein
MTLKSAALLALIGTILMSVLLVWNFVSNVLNVLRGAEAPVVLFASFVYPQWRGRCAAHALLPLKKGRASVTLDTGWKSVDRS